LVDPGVDTHTRTLSARYYKDGAEILVKQDRKNPRRLTPEECKRLMGFPPAFKIVVSDTQAYKQFGNTVVVPMVAKIAKTLVPYLSGPRSQAESVVPEAPTQVVRRERPRVPVA
jgi:DNA (cytosine-5)-methyltransferase 1